MHFHISHGIRANIRYQLWGLSKEGPASTIQVLDVDSWSDLLWPSTGLFHPLWKLSFAHAECDKANAMAFGFGRVNSSRWLAVHIHAITKLDQTQPDVFQWICFATFVVRKTKWLFSIVALDQVHEQYNAMTKVEDGVIGLTSNPSALCGWMLPGPEFARMGNEFETQLTGHKVIQENHEQQSSTQKMFVTLKCNLWYMH